MYKSFYFAAIFQTLSYIGKFDPWDAILFYNFLVWIVYEYLQSKYYAQIYAKSKIYIQSLPVWT